MLNAVPNHRCICVFPFHAHSRRSLAELSDGDCCLAYKPANKHRTEFIIRGEPADLALYMLYAMWDFHMHFGGKYGNIRDRQACYLYDNHNKFYTFHFGTGK